MSDTAPQRTPVNVITGPLGAGKTTTVLHLAAGRPAGERWAVLVNDYGAIGVDGAVIGAGGDGLAVREIAGGCICCSANVELRVALTRLLREVRPDRLLVEPTGLARPAGVVDVLREDGLARALDLRATLCIADPAALAARDLPDLLRDQLELADVVVLNRTDLARAPDLVAARTLAEGLYPARTRIVETAFGRVDPALLDLPAATGSPGGRGPDVAASPALPTTIETHRTLDAEHALTQGAHGSTCGWRFPADLVFARPALEAVLAGAARLPGVVRLKAVVRTGRDWTHYDGAGGAIASRPSAWRRDSRVEVVAAPGAAPDWPALGSAIRAAAR